MADLSNALLSPQLHFVYLIFIISLWSGSIIPQSTCFTIPNNTNHKYAKSTRNDHHNVQLGMNFFSDLGDALTGGKLQVQTSLPYSPPLCEIHSISFDTDTIESSSFAVQERGLSWTDEDFDVYCPARQERSPVVRVRGAMLHLPGKDKMRIQSARDGGSNYEEVAVLDRALMTVTPTYDIYRGGNNAEKIGWIEKKAVALTETFDVYMEGKGGIGPFKPPPAYEISGNFLERDFVMKNDQGEVVAKAFKDGIFQFDAFNHYQVQVAPGMDAILVLACTCAIDEEMDEEHKEKQRKEKEKEEGGGNWF